MGKVTINNNQSYIALAANSEKLGGKAPEYYTNPLNLLVNSNFLNPVNTNGQTSYTGAGYAIDRWINEGNTIATIGDGGIAISGTSMSDRFTQYVSYKFPANKVFTLSVALSDGTIIVSSGAAPQSPQGTSFIWHSENNFYVAAAYNDTEKLKVDLFNPNGASTIVWAALYEGTYTADNVPPPFFYPKRLEMLNVGLPVQPRNLLDNSDFTNPVNQREFVSGNTIAAYTYFLDRWYHGSEDSRVISLSSYGLGLISGTTIMQKVSGINAGKTVTFAVCLSDERIFLCSVAITYNQDKSWIRLATSWNDLLDLYIDTQNDTADFVVYSKTNITIAWAALYEGFYITETLPPYVPKGYAAELLACKVADTGGIDADTLGGTSADQYAQTVNGISPGGNGNVFLTPEALSNSQIGTWDGNTLPNDIPIGITFVTAAATSAGHGFPIGYCTVFAVKNDVSRTFQLLVVKEDGRMYIRSSKDGTTWGEWQTYLRDSDTAADSSKFNGKTWANMLTTVYPVGSIYLSVNSTSPASLFGGTWEQLKDRFLLGAGSTYASGATGGEAEHTLSISEMPAHSHHIFGWNTSLGGGSKDQAYNWGDDHYRFNNGGAHTSMEGGGTAHNNMPPYLAVYMWKRVS